MDPQSKALESILGDMDDMEGKKMFNGDSGNGFQVTISVTPGEGAKQADSAVGDADDGLPADHDAEMCGGGCAMHSGGLAAAPSEDQQDDEEDMKLPPFLRKKNLKG